MAGGQSGIDEHAKQCDRWATKQTTGRALSRTSRRRKTSAADASKTRRSGRNRLWATGGRQTKSDRQGGTSSHTQRRSPFRKMRVNDFHGSHRAPAGCARHKSEKDRPDMEVAVQEASWRRPGLRA